MTDSGNGQQNTRMAHSQTLGRREDYGGARPTVVDQVLHGLTHDMENTGIQGRESKFKVIMSRLSPPLLGQFPHFRDELALVDQYLSWDMALEWEQSLL